VHWDDSVRRAFEETFPLHNGYRLGPAFIPREAAEEVPALPGLSLGELLMQATSVLSRGMAGNERVAFFPLILEKSRSLASLGMTIGW